MFPSETRRQASFLVPFVCFNSDILGTWRMITPAMRVLPGNVTAQLFASISSRERRNTNQKLQNMGNWSHVVVGKQYTVPFEDIWLELNEK